MEAVTLFLGGNLVLECCVFECVCVCVRVGSCVCMFVVCESGFCVFDGV